MKIKNKEYKLIMNYCQEIILFFNQNGYIEECNSYALRQLGYQSLEGVHITDIFRNAVKMEQSRLNFLFDTENEQMNTEAYRKDDTCFPVLLFVEMDEEQSGQLLIASDITSVKEAEKSMEYAKEEIDTLNYMRNEFLANITHELKTPINGIVGICNNLVEELDTQSGKHMVEVILQSCENMTTLINEFLDISKLMSGKLLLEEQEFDFQEFMNYIIELNRPKIVQKDLRFLIKVSPDIPNKLIGDSLRLGQIINNLLANAVKFTYYGNIILEVFVSERSGDEIELFILVNDTGIGIDEKDLDKIFLSFTQADSSITRKFGGTGLGLSICKNLVELMNGTINVESTKNHGSIFSFTVKLRVPSDNIYQETIRQNNEMYETVANPIEYMNYVGKEDRYEERIIDIEDLLERLTVSILMNTWEKADNFTMALKHMIPTENDCIRQLALRLCLLVRKEEQSKSLECLEELRIAMKEGFITSETPNS